jgi:hypothetical protein
MCSGKDSWHLRRVFHRRLSGAATVHHSAASATCWRNKEFSRSQCGSNTRRPTRQPTAIRRPATIGFRLFPRPATTAAFDSGSSAPGWKNGIACRRRCRKSYLSPRGHVFASRVCHELTYESGQKSGSLFYELIERPMNTHDKALAELKRSRASYRQEWNFQRMEWADRVLKYGFL